MTDWSCESRIAAVCVSVLASRKWLHVHVDTIGVGVARGVKVTFSKARPSACHHRVERSRCKTVVSSCDSVSPAVREPTQCLIN